MASNYVGFVVSYEDEVGVKTLVGAGVSVAVYDTVALADVAESPLTTDTNSEIVAGSFAAVAAGTRVRFRVENFEGRAFHRAQITT